MKILIPAALVIAACTPTTPPPMEPLPIFGPGYRAEGDQCRRVGENDFTNQFLGDASDLVACPEGMENLGIFPIETGGVEVARVQGFVLYSVPLG